MKNALLPIALAVAVLLSPGSAQAAPIEYVATDLGGGTWQYDYYLGSNTFNVQDGFTVYFDFDTSNLQDLPLASADWSPLVIQPDPTPASLGFYDALREFLVDNPPFTGPFSLTFLWTGVGAPGAQTYDLYTQIGTDLDITETGTTVPHQLTDAAPVPEPASLLLLASGLAAARTLRRKRAQS